MKNCFQFILLMFLFSLCACETSAPQIETSPKVNPQKVTVLSDLKHPWSICFLDENDVIISEKDGHLLRVDLVSKNKQIIEGFPNDLADSIRIKDRRDNSGLFEVVKHPDFTQNQWIYISYAAQSTFGTTTKVIRAKLNDNQLDDVKTILVAEPFSADLFHYGGGMVFGSDAKLFITIGERLYHERDEPALPIAQDVRDKRGKIYRLNDDGSIPNDNPDFGPEAQAGIYAIGIRAAQGITMNPEDGSIWFSEHGSTQGDELNLLQPGSNYGWPIKTTGKYRNLDYTPPQMKDVSFAAPVHYWLQTIAPTGLTFYMGTEFPSWQGDIILSGLSRGSLWRIQIENQEVVSLEELFVNDRIRSRKATMSPDGKLYILTDEPAAKLIEIRNKR